MKESLLEERIQHLRDVCKSKGMRITPQRIEIYRQVAQSCSHPDAETIYASVKKIMPNVSFDTVYRTLASLEEIGMVFRVDNQLPKARFDADKKPHNHFVCIECNEVYDIEIEPEEETKVSKNALKFGEVKDINVQVRGICKNCLEKQSGTDN